MRIIRKWKNIPGWENIYKASSDGKIYSCRSRRNLNIKINQVHGYCEIEFNLEGKASYHRVHRLVALTYLPNPLNLPFVNHIDGNKQNNCVTNLEWINGTDNNLHAIKTGLVSLVRKKGRIYTVSDGVNMFKASTMKEITAISGISKSQIRRILLNDHPQDLCYFSISYTCS